MRFSADLRACSRRYRMSPESARWETSTACSTYFRERFSGRRARSAISAATSSTMPLPILPAAPSTATFSSLSS
ncbi:MAG TPA: hypothetical protein DD417_09965 [Elusimicrobia bacterium]|nr:hypothetical protein [Elusimicrobiota bacterium]